MARRFFGRLRQDTNGGVLVEFALVIVTTMVLIGGIVDFYMWFWQWNSATKAVERGARIAAVSNPVANGLFNLNVLSLGSFSVGSPVAPGAFKVQCDGAAQKCTCSGTQNCPSYDATAMNWIVYGRGNSACAMTTSPYSVGMCNMFPGYWRAGQYQPLTPANVVVEYRASGLGFYTNTQGIPPPVVTVDVWLQNVAFEYFFLGPLLGWADLTNSVAARTSITSEDLSSLGN